MRITLIPEIQTQDDLSDALHRLAFYFGHKSVDSVAVSVASPAITVQGCVLPDGFDPAAADRLTKMRDVVTVETTRSAMSSHLAEADVVLRRNHGPLSAASWEQTLSNIPESAIDFGVDIRSDRMEGSLYIQAAFATSASTENLESISRKRFADLASSLGGAQRAYLLATGPSIGKFGEHDFSDGVVIACNTTVLDDELMDHANPDIVTFADPIFHFGCSVYAQAFRAQLVRQSQRHDFAIIVPLKYYELLVSLCPEVEGRVIGVPFRDGPPNLNLESIFSVPPVDNVATLLMLPVGCTLATDVAMLGFDGRSQSESYFWKHNVRTQLHDLLPEIQKVHPSFFDTDYADYYDRHSDNLERYFSLGESLGHSFHSMEDTFIPALRRRTVTLDSSTFSGALKQPASYRFVSINPDLEDNFGHYLLYDTAVRDAAAVDGGDVLTLTSTAFEADEPWLVPAFTDNSWSVLRRSPSVHVERFKEEFRNVYQTVTQDSGDTSTAIYMYVGSERHLLEVARVVLEFEERVPVLINLFYSHKDIRATDLGSAGPEVGVGLSLVRFLQSLQIHVFADSEGLQRGIQRLFGQETLSWPMFSVSPSGDQQLAKPTRFPGHGVVVYAPGNLQFAKGYDLVSRLAARLSDHSESSRITLVGRVLFRRGTDPRLTKEADLLRRHAIILDGVLDDDEYAAAFRGADVILIPYRLDEFKTRTSAVVSDAMMLGKPVVATRGTWVGDIVERYDIGVTFEDGSVKDLENAVWMVVNGLDYYRGRAADARAEWEETHNPRLLVDAMKHVLEAPPADEYEVNQLHLVESVGAIYARLAAYEAVQGDRSVERELRRKLAKRESQVRSIKSSPAFRLATRTVGFLKRLGPLYVPIRAIARRIAKGS